ncbi:MAG: hypothetical protein HUJ93_09235, partial [Bacteroidales bacterium]|nr:hypothetical protein [Bacteroidales bacterium]
MMKRDSELEKIYKIAIEEALDDRTEFLTPEHILYAIALSPYMKHVWQYFHTDVDAFLFDIEDSFDWIESVQDEIDEKEYELLASTQTIVVMERSEEQAFFAGKEQISTEHVLAAILTLEDSYASYLLKRHTTSDTAELLSVIVNKDSLKREDSNTEGKDAEEGEEKE